MLRLVLSVLGVGSTLIGLLASMRRIHHRVFIPQLVVTEYAWFFTLFNALVTVTSLSRRATLGWGYGLLGTLLAATPLFRLRLAIRDMDQAMRHGFGHHYERCIPPTIAARLSSTHWTWDHPFEASKRRPEIHLTPDVPFVRRGHRDLKMDIYEPPFAGPHPAILVLHGGGWQNGDKSL